MLIYKAVQSNIASKDKKKKWHPCLIKMGNVVDTQMIGETIAERSSLTAGDAVSYTHLDVYKRQLPCGTLLHGFHHRG